MAAVQLSELRKVYPNGNVGVAGASFEIDDGELLVLVGPSGCGKTTLLRMIAGLETISSGILSIDGRVVNEVAPKDRDIAMVFQNYALYPHMTVAENLGFGLRLRGHKQADIDQRVIAAAKTLELESRLTSRPAALSGGQRQRVALGRALVRDPQVFLLDEPLSNLDAKLRLSMRVEIARLHRQLKATMIYVTHDQIEAMTLGQRIVVLDGGVIQQIDTPMNLYEKPANLFVAGFVGSPAMNLLHGKLRSDHGWVLTTVHGDIALGEPPQATAWQPWREREVVLGIRPEDLQPQDTDDVALSAQLEVLEPVGNEIFLNLRYGAQALVSRVSPRALPEPGSTVPLGLVARRLHLFDAASGTRIGP
ncbi:sn-glycerol-3-phosphate ABC transporter ATP-binding protein UgpC [Rhodanobacter glycinis]|uniref:sn-glycerol-3-phosphate ABC transporter ATP-binding protein UgpC n=1 Tax=Rhodanobacter glycinis TaxID=582702 RepID=A0A502FC43_9GAMM|nr:sn-glycerol-3-phosphate ABC transporter ATP-binding protein UgpC [Rhodanobacter glycinis]TPG09889.1 sn-glycerol-3-phosphate ABC transporter ATP-binding protein UgpC [Rhodanobacter glycinis]TPG46863.1 sn-glycerol-3-phosphate ABC transporter ATP-binding protein UgpC [Rhodanobacter glycinis]